MLSVVLILFAIDKLFPQNLNRFYDHSPILLDKNGNLLSTLLSKDEHYRFPLTAAEISPTYLKMLLAYEDKRFYHHPGVDPFALLRAALQCLKSGKKISGGSTLTMQTIRLLEQRPRTFTNKTIEIFRALQLELHYSKKEILEMYLTLAPFGGNLSGIRAASLCYFGKEPKALTPAESALLVVLPQSPTRLKPNRHPELAKQYRDKVLNRMVTLGIFDRHNIDEAKEDSVSSKMHPFPRHALHLAYQFRANLNRQNLTSNSTHQNKKYQNQIFPTYIDPHHQTSLEILLRQEQTSLDPHQTIAALIIENETHEIISYVGSSDFFDESSHGQIDMIQAYRSPGSTLKPFIYALGFEEGIIHPDTDVEDQPHNFNGYAPSNFKDVFHGTVSIRSALQHSLNIPAVLVLDQIGPGRFSSLLRDLNVTLKFPKQHQDPSLPLALGGVGIRLYDLASLYVVLANRGIYQPLKLIKPKEDLDPLSPTSVFRQQSTDWVTHILQETPAPEGTLGWQFAKQVPIAYKTGTSYGHRDAWALGYTADYTVAVWVGKPDGTPSPEMMGRKAAAPILFKVFQMLPDSGKTLANRYSSVDIIPSTSKNCPLQDSSLVAPMPKDPTLHIQFPKDGSLILIENNKNPSLTLEIAQGTPPFHVFINHTLLPDTYPSPKIPWSPHQSGFYEITVLDTQGHSETITIEIKIEG